MKDHLRVAVPDLEHSARVRLGPEIEVHRHAATLDEVVVPRAPMARAGNHPVHAARERPDPLATRDLAHRLEELGIVDQERKQGECPARLQEQLGLQLLVPAGELTRLHLTAEPIEQIAVQEAREPGAVILLELGPKPRGPAQSGSRPT